MGAVRGFNVFICQRGLCWFFFFARFAKSDYNSSSEAQEDEGDGDERCRLSGRYTRGAIGEHQLMFACGNLEGAEHIVDAANLCGFPIDGGFPSRVVDFAQNCYATLWRYCLIVELVGLTAGELYATTVERRAVEDGAELLIGYCSVLRIKPCETRHFGIGTFDEAERANEPSVAVGVGVANGLVGVGTEDEVARVEHIENGRETVARYFRHITFRFRDCSEIAIHLVVELAINEVLIATKFHCVVTTDTLVEITAVVARFIERITS